MQLSKDKIEEIKSYLTGENARYTLFYAISGLFILLNAYMVYRNFYFTLLLPLGLVILYIFFYRVDYVLLLITFCTPLAVNMTQFEFNVGISLPTEPLMFGVLLLFVLKLFYDNNFDPKVWKHPMTIIIGFQFLWILITSITSQFPVISFKFMLARLWFVIPFYIFAIHLFRKKQNIRLFIWLYAIPLVIVIIYTTYQHSLWAFDEDAGHWVMSPFYNDHTAYGAILAMFVPIFIGFMFTKSYSRLIRLLALLVLGFLFLALYLSYCRAAWISLVVALSVYLIILFRLKFKYIFFSVFLFGMIFYTFQFEILDALSKNKQGTSGDFMKHVQSISNITTDASNLERLNRWASAIRMFESKPVFGYGPGTYQFEYAPFQQSEERTLISTNAGDRGNAHSEYIGPLSEQGILGMILVVIVFVYSIIVAMRVYRRTSDKEVRMLTLGTMLGLITYYFHGLMNNFLDSDKASVPVWGFIAVIIALDLYYLPSQSYGNQKQ
ncbi:MAG: O-antigen ligase family protein [Bacteroidetes bacterium]|nr:O-antigen ligase family protein [Bacteroidota bacterium]